MSYGKHSIDCIRMFPDCPCNRCAKDNAWDRRGNRCCGLRLCSSATPCSDFRKEQPDVIGRKPEAFGYSAAMQEQIEIERQTNRAK